MVIEENVEFVERKVVGGLVERGGLERGGLERVFGGMGRGMMKGEERWGLWMKGT